MAIYPLQTFGRICTLLHIPSAHAQGVNPCILDILECPGAEADDYLASVLITGAKTAFVGILFAMFVFYGFKLIAGSDNDSTVSEVYQAYGHAFIGTVLAGGAFMFASSFAVPGDLVDQYFAITVFEGVVILLRSLLYSALVFNIFYQGFRLISSQDEGQADKAKKQFIYGLVGAGLVVLSERLVAAFSSTDADILATEAVGIANFLGTILGGLLIVSLFVAGIYLILAVNEQNKNRAKNVIIAGFSVLLIVLSSLILINFVYSGY